MTATIIIIVALVVAANVLYARYRGRRRSRRIYQEALQRAFADGILTSGEMDELERLSAEKELTEREVRMAAVALYRRALHAAAEDEKLTPEEDEQLYHLQERLGLSERDLGSDLMRIRRLRTLAAITAGDLPVIECPIDLVTDERCHWVVHATLAQRLDMPAARHLRSVRFAVLEPAPFHALGQRDPLRPSELILPTDLGVLIVTSRRTVLQGARRTVTVPHARVQSVLLFRDGVALIETSGGTRYFLVDDPELTAAVMLHAARIRRAAIRPSSADRSA
jgi:hypothetical protein